jgi:succinate dehydrogenase / fumarate reductase, cytochrome b subunit
LSTSTAPPTQTFTERNHFLLRKLHSLSGVIPVGVFLIEHLITNSMPAIGAAEDPGAKFNKSVKFIADLPFLYFLEFFGIFLPLAFHAIYGIKIAMSADYNSAQYPYMANKRFSWQRITGYIAFVFIIVHLAKFRFAHWINLAEVHFLHTDNYFETVYTGLMDFNAWGWHVPSELVLGFYAIGIAAASFHFANGLWTFAISWGITIGAQAQKRFGYVAAIIGISLFSLGILSLYGFATRKAPEVGRGSTSTVVEQGTQH